MTETALFPGIYRGIVHDNRDPLGKGRLKVRVNQLLGNTPTDWAWSLDSAYSRGDLPTVGQGVWVTFEGGDVSFPVWIGTFGSSADTSFGLLVRKIPNGTPLNEHIIKEIPVNGDRAISALETLVKLANAVKTLENTVVSLQSQIVSLQNQINAM